MSSHSVPLSCPYCAGENLHPHASETGGWECRECLRAFAIHFLGLVPSVSAANARGDAPVDAMEPSR